MSKTFEQLDIEEFEREIRPRFEEMVDLLIAKRRSYGAGNLIRFGPMGIVIRAADKIDRLTNMLKDGQTANPDGDTMDDAWRDLVGYGILGLMVTQLDRERQPLNVVSEIDPIEHAEA